MREFMEGVWTWGRLSEPHGYDFNGTFVLHPGGNLVIDPVEPTPEVLERLEREGVSRIVLTNRNHVRAASRVHERTRAHVAIHPADAEYARGQGAQIEEELVQGQGLGPFELIGVPGKSPGELALYDRERRLLIVGDALIGNPPGKLSLLRERVLEDPPRLRESVRRLLELEFDALLVGDGVPIRHGARERLRELVQTFPAE